MTSEAFYIFTHFNKSLDTETGDWIIEGIASTPDIDRESDIVAENAVTDALKSYKKMPVLRYQHKDPIGKVLKMEYTPEGLYIKAKISNTPETKGIWQLIKDGVVRGLSIAGKIVKATKKKNKKGKEIRTIEKMELHEISVVDIPANPNSVLNVVKAYNSYMSTNKEEKIMTEQPEWLEPLTKSLTELKDAVTDLNKNLTAPIEETEAEKKLWVEFTKATKELEKADDEEEEKGEDEDEDDEEKKKKKKSAKSTDPDFKKMIADELKEQALRKAVAGDVEVPAEAKKGGITRGALAKRYNLEEEDEDAW